MAAKEEFLAAFNEHSDALFRHAFFRLSDRERALDLTQDTFIRAWDFVRAGGDVRTPKSFLFRIMNNLIIDEYRRTKTESLEEKLESNPAFEAQFASDNELETAYDEERMIEYVRSAIGELSVEYRTVVTMRYVDGFSPREIARMIGTTENAVSVRIHRAVKQLKAKLV